VHFLVHASNLLTNTIYFISARSGGEGHIMLNISWSFAFIYIFSTQVKEIFIIALVYLIIF